MNDVLPAEDEACNSKAAVLDHYALGWGTPGNFPEGGVYTTKFALGFVRRKVADVLHHDEKMRERLGLSVPEARRQNLTDAVIGRVHDYIQENDFSARDEKARNRLRNMIANYVTSLNGGDLEVVDTKGNSPLERRVREVIGELGQFSKYLPMSFVGSLGRRFAGTGRDAKDLYRRELAESPYGEMLSYDNQLGLRKDVDNIVHRSRWRHVDIKRVRGVVATACVLPEDTSHVYAGEETVRHLALFARKCLEEKPKIVVFTAPPNP